MAFFFILAELARCTGLKPRAMIRPGISRINGICSSNLFKGDTVNGWSELNTEAKTFFCNKP